MHTLRPALSRALLHVQIAKYLHPFCKQNLGNVFMLSHEYVAPHSAKLVRISGEYATYQISSLDTVLICSFGITMREYLLKKDWTI